MVHNRVGCGTNSKVFIKLKSANNILDQFANFNAHQNNWLYGITVLVLVRSLPIHYATRPNLVTVVPVLISDELLDPPNVSITRDNTPVNMVMGTKCLCNFNR